MRQGLYAQPSDAINAAIDSGLLVSTCDIQQRTGAIDAMGQPDLTDWVDVAGLTGISCMIAPLLDSRPSPGDSIRTSQQYDFKNQFHVLLAGYFTGILQAYTAVIDGVRYQVMTSEPDSQATMTRLAVRIYTL